ncbi:MAG: site-specific DNA-methyltransferase [Clostridium sp.]|nr:MAG: site-specific DNA-methyltransferase [Clostridium sp.]
MVKKYKDEGISWKYTSVLYEKGDPEYLASTVDGDGNEIKIYNRPNAKFMSISQIAKARKIFQKNEVYYKYMDRIHTTAMPQSSIRPRVMERLEGIKHSDVISIKYIPKTGKNKGNEYEQFYKGDKFRLLTWLKDVTEYKDGKWLKKDLQGTLWDGINLNNLTKEGQVEFPNGKKPELLLNRIIEMSTNEGDYVLDSFLGSGTTAAVAHKMNRNWIGIEMGEHVYTHCIKRLNLIIDGKDNGGITSIVNWNGGGGYNFYELAPTLINEDSFGEMVINKNYNPEMLARSVALHEGFEYNPDKEIFWKQSIGNENSYLYVTTQFF